MQAAAGAPWIGSSLRTDRGCSQGSDPGPPFCAGSGALRVGLAGDRDPLATCRVEEEDRVAVAYVIRLGLARPPFLTTLRRLRRWARPDQLIVGVPFYGHACYGHAWPTVSATVHGPDERPGLRPALHRCGRPGEPGRRAPRCPPAQRLDRLAGAGLRVVRAGLVAALLRRRDHALVSLAGDRASRVSGHRDLDDRRPRPVRRSRQCPALGHAQCAIAGPRQRITRTIAVRCRSIARPWVHGALDELSVRQACQLRPRPGDRGVCQRMSSPPHGREMVPTTSLAYGPTQT